MNEQKKFYQHRYFRYFLFLSIALHLSLALLFVVLGFKKRISAFLMPATTHQPHRFVFAPSNRPRKVFTFPPTARHNQPKRLAKLTAPRSRFGWVFFQDPPKKADAKMPEELPTTHAGDPLTAKAPVATEKTPSNKPVEKVAKQTLSAHQQDAVQPPSALEAGNDTTPGVVEHEKAKQIEPVAQAANVGQRIARIKDLQEKLGHFQPPQQQAVLENRQQIASIETEKSEQTEPTNATTFSDESGTTDGVNAAKVRGVRRAQGDAPKRNLIALTKGYIEKWEGEDGKDLIDRDGDPTIKPSLEELKYLSYESKITWCLQAAWKQNFGYNRAKMYEGDAVIEFAIDQHGNLIKSTLLQSSGYPELDAMIMKNMKFASPFPPLPQHFETKIYTTGRIIQVRSQKFTF